MPKCLIMGGSYFIGKAVLETLKDHMTCYVLNRGTRSIDDQDVIHLKSDRKDIDSMKKLLKTYTFDYVVDISGYDVNDIDILLDSLNLDSLKTYVFISTAAVYDITKGKTPYNETSALGSNPPYHVYGNNKIEAEKRLEQRLKKEQLVIFRPPYVYGPYNYILRERMMFYVIDKDLPLYIPLSRNYIQFVYVYDLALDILKALEGVIPFGIYNVGSKEAMTFYEWVSLIEKAMGKKARLTFVNDELHHTNPTDYFPFLSRDVHVDVTKIKTHFSHQIDMIKGLEQAYIDYKKVKEEIKIPDKVLDTWMKLNLLLG